MAKIELNFFFLSTDFVFFRAQHTCHFTTKLATYLEHMYMFVTDFSEFFFETFYYFIQFFYSRILAGAYEPGSKTALPVDRFPATQSDPMETLSRT